MNAFGFSKEREDAEIVQGQLPADPRAHFLLYLSSKRLLTLAAVSPRLRLLSEVAQNNQSDDSVCTRVQRCDEKLYCLINAGRWNSRLHKLGPSLWWCIRASLPVTLRVDNACVDVVSVLPPTLRSRVTRLLLKVQRSEGCRCYHDEHINADGNSSTHPLLTRPEIRCKHALLDTLRSFPNVGHFDVDCGDAVDPVLASRQVARGLGDLSTLHVKELCIRHYRGVPEFRALMECHHLERLVVEHCDVQSFGSLDQCVSLREVTLDNCNELTSLAAFAGLPALQKLVVKSTSVSSVEGLERCPALTQLLLWHNSSLTTLACLASAPCLRRLAANWCGLRNLGQLGKCRALMYLDVAFNYMLSDASGLAEALLLCELDVRETGVRDLNVLSSCHAIHRLDASGCTALRQPIHLPGVEIVTNTQF